MSTQRRVRAPSRWQAARDVWTTRRATDAFCSDHRLSAVARRCRAALAVLLR